MIATQKEREDVGSREAVFTQVLLLHVTKICLQLEGKEIAHVYNRHLPTALFTLRADQDRRKAQLSQAREPASPESPGSGAALLQWVQGYSLGSQGNFSSPGFCGIVTSAPGKQWFP